MTLDCCRICGHVTKYTEGSVHYECMKRKVSPRGICDRFQRKISTVEIMKRIDAKIKELEEIPDGEYTLTKLPDYGQNYRVQ